MKNSPTICQSYVSQALKGFRQQNPDLITYHCMDDILIAGKGKLSKKLKELTTQLSDFGLKIAPEKVQKMQPWKYLGWKILGKTIVPQKLEITDKIETLNNVQKLLRTINWVRTLLGIDNELLTPLFEMLRSNTTLTAPRQLTPHGKQALPQIADVISQSQAFRIKENLDINLSIN